MNKIAVLIATLSIIHLSFQTCSALHSDALSDWNEVITSGGNPFNDFPDNFEAIEDVTPAFHFQQLDNVNVKKRKRSTDDDIDKSTLLPDDPRLQFDAKAIVSAYQNHIAQEKNPKQVLLHCICDQDKPVTISSEYMLERHFASTRHTQFLKQELSLSLEEKVKNYFIKHDNDLLKTIAPVSNKQTEDKKTKKNTQKRNVSIVDGEKAIETVKKMDPITVHCFCEPNSTISVHTTGTLYKHLKSLKHRTFKKTQAIAEDPDFFERQESNLIEETHKELTSRSWYQCTCGSRLSVSTPVRVKKHLNSKKHRFAIEQAAQQTQ